MKEINRSFGLNNNQLKLIAMVSMLIDHIGVQLFPGVQILRILGRLAMPIFAYMITEGCFYTRNRVKYLSLIALLAALCQVVYFVAEGSLYMSILVTFSLSIVTIFAIDGFLKKKTATSLIIAVAVTAGVLFAALALPVLLKANGFDIDYGIFGILLPVAIYFAKGKYGKLIAATVVITALAVNRATIQWYALAAIPLLYLYNGQRGRLNLKYLFYIFYPTHLAVLHFLDMLF